MKYLSKIFTILSLLAFVACTDDLDVEPRDSDTILDNNYYTSDTAYIHALAGIYANLSVTGTDGTGSTWVTGIDAGTSHFGRSVWNLMELTTDEVVWSYENDPGTSGLNRCNWTSGNILLRGTFGRMMAGVAFANEFLRQTTSEKLESRGLTTDQINEIAVYRAEARFLRALSYYYMLDFFGKAPFVVESDPVGSKFKPMQAERPQLFEFVESELLAIEEELAEPLTNEYGRVDQAGAWMLLAKLYLNAEVYIDEDRYADCISYCNKIIGSGFSLNPVYLNNFKADNHLGDARNEIIFPVLSDGARIQNYGPSTVIVNGQVGSIESNGSDFGVAGWGGALRVTEQFSNTIMNGPYSTDERNTLITDTPGRSIDIPSINDNGTGYIIAKFSNLDSNGNQGSHEEISDTDFPLFRLADVYLMYVEAHLRGGGGSEATAVGLFNDLRQRANNPNLISATDLSLDLVLDERLIELHWEGHRRQDLIRFNLFTGGAYNWSWKGNSADGVPIANYRDVFAMPTASLAANPNLKQNTGY